MADDERRIVIRISDERWRSYDDKRHAERTTFQRLGAELFERWFSGESSKVIEKSAEKGDIMRDTDEAEDRWTSALIRILRSGNERAARAIKSNLVAFDDYATAVPERKSELSDIDSEQERLAALDRRLESLKKSGVESADAPPVDRREDDKGTPKKPVRTGAPRKKVG